jgi:predicted exporter
VSRERRFLLVGTALLALLATVVALRIDVATDITHFLPRGADHDDVHLARELAAGELSRTMVLLVDAEDASAAAAASRRFEQELRAEPVVAEHLQRLVTGSGEAVEDAMWQTYRRHRVAFAAPDADAAQRQLTDDALDASIAELKRKLQTPMSTLLVKVVPEDPLRLLPQLFERLMAGRGEGLKLVDGRFVTEAEDGAVLFLTTTIPMTNATAMRPLLAGIDAAFARAEQRSGGGLTLHQSGTHLFALAAEAGIRSDIQRVSIGSAIGLTTLFLLLFRSLRLLLLVLPILGMGFLCGTTACLLWFDSVHGLTLAFGAALIGVSVDYGVHFHCHHLHAGGGSSPRASLRRVWPGLGLGALTTITGFLALVASSFPGLRQLAVFATFGIAAAALSTWLFLPALASRRARPTAIASGLAALLRRTFFAPDRSRIALAAPIVLVLLAVAVGLPQLRWNDGLADLNKIDPEIQARDEAVRARVVRFEQRRLVVATGADEEAALQANERVARALAPLVADGALSGFRSLAPMLPSAATQRAVDAAVRGDETLWPRLERALQAHQFVPAAFARWQAFVAQEPPAPLRYRDLAGGPLAQMVEPFRFTWSGGVGFVTFLHDLHDETALRAALADVDGGRLIDIAGTLSGAYGAYRQRLLQLWMLGLGAVLLLVAVRHRALRPTLIAYVPAVLSAAGTAAVLTLLGLELNMLSLVALLMVVSMGVDYGVFLAEHRDDEVQRDATLLAVTLAGASTMLGFGLLSLSSQPPLFHIGLTSAVGVLLCLVLAPTVCALASRTAPGTHP